MNDKTEKLGMRTMNQSLFQLLMKRKIELKTAFEFSPAPEDLDLILKKVGV
jgi:twitching motility protein PilT